MPNCVICNREVSKGSFNIKDKFGLTGGGFICKTCAGKMGIKGFMPASMMTAQKARKKYYDMYPDEAPASLGKTGAVDDAAADKEFIEKINAIPDCRIILANELKHLRRMLSDGEEVIHAVNGLIRKDSFALFDSRIVMKSSSAATETWLAALTNTRIILINKHLIVGTDCISLPLESINSVSYQIGMMASTITLMHGVSGIVVENIRKGFEKPFADKANEAIKSVRNTSSNSTMNTATVSGNTSFSVADELVKLKGLLDQGIITQQEFDAQKLRLLK